jgi:long-subunit acyl-CoA synthetase (AMP-forming)
MNVLCPDSKAIYDEHLCDTVIDMTYHEAHVSIRRSAAAFQALGVKKGDHVAVFGENSAHWLFVDQGIQTLGASKFISLSHVL